MHSFYLNMIIIILNKYLVSFNDDFADRVMLKQNYYKFQKVRENNINFPSTNFTTENPCSKLLFLCRTVLIVNQFSIFIAHFTTNTVLIMFAKKIFVNM